MDHVSFLFGLLFLVFSFLFLEFVFFSLFPDYFCSDSRTTSGLLALLSTLYLDL